MCFQTASVLEEVSKLKDENLLIVHGTADGEILFTFTFIGCYSLSFISFYVRVCLPQARVHFQHSAELLSRLVKVEANYSLQLYPDEGHMLRDPRSVQHFQRTVVNFLQSCLTHSIFLEPIEYDEEEDD